ncbi:MAG: ABC transporter permease [Opitutaceae bacterium]|jgi:ABC-type transport system involved in multi-copper enzyme maturation permease subunit|nr:ABC transporter permease [Opitutaceae bacterium]
MRLLAIARNTLTEALRQKLFALLLLLALALAASSQFFRDFNFGSSELKFIADFGFGAIVFFGSALTITATAQLFFSEIENRTALTLLSKPIRRTEFILGKFLGVAAITALFTALTTLLLAALLWHRENALMAAQPEAFAAGRLVSYGAVFAAGLLQWLKFTLLAALTLLIASYSNTNLYTVVVSFFVLLICHLQYLARDADAHIANPVARFLTRLLGHVFPNFQLYNITDQIARDTALPGGLVLTAALTALFYNAVILALAALAFRRREI